MKCYKYDPTVLVETIRRVRRVYVIGNGGSYANAMHLCNDLLSVGVKAYSLDPATLAAFANDHGWQSAFARWISIVGEEGDLLIAMSGSGTSVNILNAIKIAESREMIVHRIFGNQWQQNMQEAEEFQLAVGHEVYRCLQSRTYSNSKRKSPTTSRRKRSRRRSI